MPRITLRSTLGWVLVAFGAYWTVLSFFRLPHAVTYDLTLDGKTIGPFSATVTIDGVPFKSGMSVRGGSHQLMAEMRDADPIARDFWVLWGEKPLGTLALASSKGALAVTVSPLPATLAIYRQTTSVESGDAPLRADGLIVGEYSVVARHGEFEERRSVTVRRNATAAVKIEFPLGILNLAAEPADAEFELSGNRREWRGKLPAKVADVPVGDYRLVVSRQGWLITEKVSVTHGDGQARTVIFPYGSIAVTSEPAGLTITSDGVASGETPLTIRELRPGNYTLTASDGENALTATAVVAEKKETTQAFQFRYGSVEIKSEPAGATVNRGGRALGVTPFRIERVADGVKFEVELRLAGYAPRTLSVIGGAATAEVRLVNEEFNRWMRVGREALAGNDLDAAKTAVLAALKMEPQDEEARRLDTEIAAAMHRESIAVVERAIVASGGRPAVGRLREYQAVYVSSVERPDARVATRLTVYVSLPDKIRLDEEITVQPKGAPMLAINIGRALGVPAGPPAPVRTARCLAGGKWWRSSTAGAASDTDMDAELRVLLAQLQSAEAASLLPLLGADYRVDLVPEATNAPAGAAALLTHRPGRPDLTFYFNRTSGLPAGFDREPTENRRTGERWTGFRAFDGLRLPGVIRRVTDGQVSAELRLESFGPLSSLAVFQAPANQ
ncbi:MAG: PEGA domain-containing protein [Verrucomicrobia bacterium]|nr:PEGA domain-containing protein [Verrucomicrobiota bacterium]